MEIAFAHSNMDFDSLAAQFALTKLYPSCRMVLGYPLSGNVRNFLSLNRSYLPIVQIKYLDLTRVTRFFLVDCQHIERLDNAVQKIIPTRPLTIFDHHSSDREGLIAVATKDSQIENVGAATTILVEKIKEQKIELSQFDATLLAIGIFEDTGCLTYAGTTPRDAQCIAYLIQHGADLSVVREYIKPKMEQEQVELLEELLKGVELLHIQGHKFVVARASLPKYVEGLATVTRQLLDLESADGAFTVALMKDRVHIVGRADPRVMSVRAVVQAFGGDGHPGAGSAVAKGACVDAVAEKVKAILSEQAAPQPLARDLMVSPVRTVKPTISMDEAGRLMLRYNLDGLVVAEADKIVGIVSRRDIDQSSHHKLGHARVSGFMSQPVITISEETTLSEIQELMAANDIGRLPVVNISGALVGLVSRRDVLKSLFGAAYASEEDLGKNMLALSTNSSNLSSELGRVEQDTLWLCRSLGTIAEDLGMQIYAVGGFVRDLLLGIPTFDLDFVIEGTAQQLADKLLELYPAKFELVASHDRFQTANLIYHGQCGDHEVDLSTARTEFYEFPAALPEVEASGLDQDLLRRDFTINALAVALNPQRFGQLIDLFNGLGDLQEKVVRILHPFSFIEDPTRMVRAARFAGRLGFHLDAKTKEQARRASQMGIFDDLGGVRIKAELRMILESPLRLNSLNLLAELGGNLRYLDTQLEYGESQRKSIRRAERLLARYTVDVPWVVYLGALLSDLPVERLQGLLERLMLTNHQKEVIVSGLDLHRQMPLAMGDLKRSEIFEMMQGRPRESLAIAAAVGQVGSYLRRAVKLYLEELADTKLDISGADLIASGFKPGPQLGAVLKHVLAARLDGDCHNRDQQLQMATTYFNQD